MKKHCYTILTTFCLVIVPIFTSCVKYGDQPNKKLDYDQLDVSFQATLPKGYALEENSLFGIYATCTRDEKVNTNMAENSGIAKYSFTEDAIPYLYKSAEGEAVVGKKGDHNYKFYAFYPYDASVTDLSAIPVNIPATIDWKADDTPDLTMLLAAQATVTSIIAPVPMTFEAVAQCRLTIRIPNTTVPVIKSLKVAPVKESVFKGQLAWFGTYDIFEGKATSNESSGSKSITVNFGSGYTLPEGYTEISFVMGEFKYPSGGLQLQITKGDGTTITKKMFEASEVFAAGSSKVYTLS